MYPNDEKDDQHLLKALEERVANRPKPSRHQPR